MRWQKIALIGVGLLGGSLGQACRTRRLAGRVEGYVRRRASIRECVKAGAVDHATTDLAEAVDDADLVVFCTPLSQMRPLAEMMLPRLQHGAIVTDVGSVKASVVKELEPIIARAGAHFVGGHPMAGAEKTGVRAAAHDLFKNRVCVITPTRRSSPMAVKRLKEFWHDVGSHVLVLNPVEHDQLVSRSSHLVHVAASEIAHLVLDPKHGKTQPKLCANGFRDTTRVASGSPEMWRDIALANRRFLDRELGNFIRKLVKFQSALRGRDSRAIQKFFTEAKRRRDAWKSPARSPE